MFLWNEAVLHKSNSYCLHSDLPVCPVFEVVADSTHTVKLEFPHSLGILAEGVMTNGSGMVQFSRGFMRFGKTLPIVPVALRVTVPWNIQTHTLTSSFAANLFWFCFVPWVRLDATVLKPLSLAQVRAFFWHLCSNSLLVSMSSAASVSASDCIIHKHVSLV